VSNLQALVRDVAEQRRLLELVNSEIAGALAVFRENHAELYDYSTELKKRLAATETELRVATVSAYLETGDKKPVPGVGVRVTRGIDYPRDIALQWAIDHKMCLALEEQSFRDIMLAYGDAQRPEWVAVTEEPMGTIARDLSAFVADPMVDGGAS